MMKRIEEAKQLLLGPDHQSDPELVKIFKTSITQCTDITFWEDDDDDEPLEKGLKLEPKIEVLTLDEVENMLNDCENVPEEKLVTICASILEHKIKLKQCISLVKKFESQTLPLIVLPMLDELEQDLDCLSLLSPSSQKVILESLSDTTNPDWKILTFLNQLNVNDCTSTQTCLASVLVKQGHNKDIKLGKYLLTMLKILPKNLDPFVYDLMQQAVCQHSSFIKKACETEMKKFA